MYLNVLKGQYGASENIGVPDSYLIGSPLLPFYQPWRGENYLSILGFNKTPLSDVLIRALIQHPELAPQATIVRWIAEQEVVMAGSLEDLAWHFVPKEKRRQLWASIASAPLRRHHAPNWVQIDRRIRRRQKSGQ